MKRIVLLLVLLSNEYLLAQSNSTIDTHASITANEAATKITTATHNLSGAHSSEFMATYHADTALPGGETAGVRLTKPLPTSPATYATDQFLTVDEKGALVIARYQLRINKASEWSNKVLTARYVLPPLSAVKAYISQHGHLPGVPSARQVVNEGVDLVRMNAILLEKVEELTLYSLQLEKQSQQLRQNEQQRQQELQSIRQQQAELKQLVEQLHQPK